MSKIPQKVRPPEVERGFPVLKLPKRGEDLIEGRQYELSPLARAYVQDRYGWVLPRVVECLNKRRPAMRHATLTTNLETGESKWSVLIDPPREATFRAWIRLHRIFKFSLDIAWLAEREHAGKHSHKVSDFIKQYTEIDKSHEPKAWHKKRDDQKAKHYAKVEVNLDLLLK